MAKTVIKVLIDFEAPNVVDPEPPNPPGEGLTSPLAEIDKIIRDGCGASYTYIRYYEYGPGIGSEVFYIEEVL
jgi:hypothetical protein